MSEGAVADIGQGWHPDPSSSLSLHADAYTKKRWFDADQSAIISRSWLWICHSEKLRARGSFVAEAIAGQPILAIRGLDGELRAFYNVCQHRGH